jgi:hypothetical protein
VNRAYPAVSGFGAFAVYAVLSVVMTWPLLGGLGSDVPGDLGDSLLNMWILGWGAEHVPQLLTGRMSWADFWNANIFHPEPLTLALSEHLFGQVLQILPVYWLTGNIILSYNLLFISTFALSALGMFLLVRDLTGDARAAFVAGLVFGFLPYRIASVPHLQVISSQWMPFALFGLNRFVTTGRLGGLLGGSAALVMQNWSCGYYLLYFTPFVPLFLVHRMWSAGTLGSPRTWAGLGAGAAGTVVLTVPFLLPYLAAQRQLGFERPFAEVVKFSANGWSYLTASENLNVWGAILRVSPRAEGETFLGLVPWLLAAVALSGLPSRRMFVSSAPPWRTYATALLSLLVVVQLIALLAALLFGGIDLGFISARSPGRLLIQLSVALGLLLALSPASRTGTLEILRSPITIVFAATILAMWLSLGSGSALYRAFYDYVPGFNGVRVPARYAMIAGVFLAVLAGFGAMRVFAWIPAPRQAAVWMLAALVLLEGAAVPMEINRRWNANEAMPPARVMPHPHAPPVYARIKALPAGSVVTEFPFGDGAWEIRYVYYAAAHFKPITNGYSGSFPPRYQQRVALLRDVTRDPDAAWQSLRQSGTTHVIVHRSAFADNAAADAVEAWLRAHGAREAERFEEGDVLFEL